MNKIFNGNNYFRLNILTILMICSCAVLMVYMQYSKHRWAMSGGVTEIEYIKYCHSELSFISLIVIIGLALRKKIILLVVFLSCYYIAIFNFSSWFIQGRPFSFFDIYRTLQLVIFYPEFLTKIPQITLLKIIIFAIVPIPFLSIEVLCRSLDDGCKQLCSIKTVNKIYLVILLLTLSLPVGIYANTFQYNTFAEVLHEFVYSMKLKKNVKHPEEFRKLLGIEDKGSAQMPLWNLRTYNILLFIIETAPYDVFPPLEELCLITANDWLAKHGRIYNKHYSTYPETDRAIFSIITGRYPFLTKGDSWKQNQVLPSLASFLSKHGYSTHFLSTAPLEFHHDRSMILGMGFKDIFDVKETSTALKIVDGTKVWDRKKLYKCDDILIKKAR